MKIINLKDKQLKELVRIRIKKEHKENMTITRMRMEHINFHGVSFIVYSKEWSPERVGISFDGKFWPEEFLFIQKCGVNEFNNF